MSPNKWLRLLGFSVLIIVILMVSWNIANYYKHRGLIKITVSAIPSDSKVFLDGRGVKAGALYVAAGDHTFSASRQYFDTVTKHINTRDIDVSSVIYLLPLPNSQAARDWLSKHPDEQAKREAIGGLGSATTQSALTKKNPIINKLPVYNEHYRIDYSIGSGNKLMFTVTLYAIINQPSQYAQYQAQLQQYKAEALQFLSSNGINPSDYQITYMPNT